MTLGARIKELRKKNGYTQLSLAEKLGVTKGTVSTWETNSRRPNFETLHTLCDLFHVRMDYLSGQSDDATPPRKLSEEDINELADYSEKMDIRINADSFQKALTAFCNTYVCLDGYARKSLMEHLKLEKNRCETQGTDTAGIYSCEVHVKIK